MGEPEIKVKCMVENCHYNRQKVCQAHNLEINVNTMNKKAATSVSTYCSTFLPPDKTNLE